MSTNNYPSSAKTDLALSKKYHAKTKHFSVCIPHSDEIECCQFHSLAISAQDILSLCFFSCYKSIITQHGILQL